MAQCAPDLIRVDQVGRKPPRARFDPPGTAEQAPGAGPVHLHHIYSEPDASASSELH
jgi:hypothetical protein